MTILSQLQANGRLPNSNYKFFSTRTPVFGTLQQENAAEGFRGFQNSQEILKSLALLYAKDEAEYQKLQFKKYYDREPTPEEAADIESQCEFLMLNRFLNRNGVYALKNDFDKIANHLQKVAQAYYDKKFSGTGKKLPVVSKDEFMPDDKWFTDEKILIKEYADKIFQRGMLYYGKAP